MNEDCYDDYDQEYAEGYSAYKYDNANELGYENGYSDDYENAEEKYSGNYPDDDYPDDDEDYPNDDEGHQDDDEDYIYGYIGDYVGDDDYEEVHDQHNHRTLSHSSDLDTRHIMSGAAGSALGHVTSKRMEIKYWQQKEVQKNQTQKNQTKASYPISATPKEEKMERMVGLGCGVVSFFFFFLFTFFLLKCCS